jgi:hypothetical protein
MLRCVKGMGRDRLLDALLSDFLVELSMKQSERKCLPMPMLVGN